MSTSVISAIGILAGTLTTVSFTPQLLRIWRRRSAGDISYIALLCFICGTSLWLWYGLLITSVPVIAANVVSLLLNLSILGLKLRHDERFA
jgi:MtN3 and saliva related transmembrane protein